MSIIVFLYFFDHVLQCIVVITKRTWGIVMDQSKHKKNQVDKKKKVKPSGTFHDKVYDEVNACCFSESLKILNDNYTKKKSHK